MFTNISKSKGNQPMKFGQLIEYKMRNTFLEKSYIKCSRGTILRLFSQKSKSSIYLDQSFIYSVLIVCQVQSYRKWLKLSCRPFAFSSYKPFVKNKERSGTSLPNSFFAWLLKKIFLLLHSFTWLNFNIWLSLLREILGKMCIVIVF